MRKSLNGQWLLSSNYGNITKLKVNVPGSIYNDLLRYNLIEEPYYRANEAKMLDYMGYDYAYSRMFSLSKEDLSNEINLYFLGLDTVTEIYVNSKLVTKTFNMHRRYRININDYVLEGENELKVVIKSCLDFINEEYKKQTHELMNMQYAVKGYATIRKAHCMFGWDWGPQMPDGGIWRDAYLEIIDKARIDLVKVYQDVNNDIVKIDVNINSHVLRKGLKLAFRFSLDDYLFTKEVELEDNNIISFSIDKPKLWYPVGYGAQPLYHMDVLIIDGEEIVDEYIEDIGLRKMEIVQEEDEDGKSFFVRVNGIPVFLKGSDYIIEDNILARTSIERTKYLLDSAIKGNQNSLRIWGGALYPSDEFYHLCDQMGILIWQDLMFACGYYNMENEMFVDEIKNEIIDNVNRIHNHACIMLVCGNNENETAALNWNIPSFEYTKKWYLYQYEELIPNILKDVAPDIFYWPSSPSSGGGFNDPNSDKMGDMHYWGVWHNDEPIENYRLYYPRVMSEFGMQSFPCMKTINEFTLEEDRNIYSYVMERHQKNRRANQKIINYIGSMFKYPKDLANIAYVSQIIQAEAVRYCVEHLRRNYPRCMGSIYWQLNDCWPVASWSSIDYYGRFKALQYYSKRMYAPIIVSIEENNTQNTVYTQNKGAQTAKIVLTNETGNELNGTLITELLRFDGTVIDCKSIEFSANKYSAKEITTLTYSLTLEEQFNSVLRVKAIIGEDEYYNEVSFVRDKYLNLVKPNIKYSLEKNGNLYSLKLISDTYAKYVCIDCIKKDLIFSDNYFNLTKDEKKVITFESKEIIELGDIKIISLTDSF